MAKSDRVLRAWVGAFADRLAAQLEPLTGAAGFDMRPRRSRRPEETESGGWYVTLARHRRWRGTVFEIWCDRWADVQRHTVWYGFDTRDEAMARALRDAGRPWLGPAIERSAAVANDRPFRHRAVPLTEDEVLHATYEEGERLFFYGRYAQPRPPLSEVDDVVVCALACEFFQRLTSSADTAAWGGVRMRGQPARRGSAREETAAARAALEESAHAAARAAAQAADEADGRLSRRCGRTGKFARLRTPKLAHLP